MKKFLAILVLGLLWCNAGVAAEKFKDIKGGENISPREIDDVLYQHPAVLEAAAFATKCEHYGEKIEVGIVLKKNQKVTENDLIKHCENLIGKFKSPNKIHFLSELPKGPSGKIQRFKIQDKIK